MKILVPTKCVPDVDQKIRASDDGNRVLVDHIPFVLNPFDAVALEEAVRIGERLGGSAEVVAVGIGGDEYPHQLRAAMAVGAARAVHVPCHVALDPWNVARLLQAVVVRELPQLVIMGKQAADDDANQTGQLLAALLDWPQATFASRVKVASNELTVDRDTDYGIETLQLSLPAVITVGLRLNEPRYASLAGIMKACKQPVEVWSMDDLGVSIEPRVEVLRYRSADERKPGERLGSVDELVERLTRPGAVLHSRSQNEAQPAG
jgi:electron transfer flavoprotein beta subunit